MKKYFIGLFVLGLVVVGLAGYVISQGMQSKVDKKTYKSAVDISRDLNDYVSQKREVPSGLDQAGIKDVPETIKYEKKSDREYEFCVTYKADKSYGGGPDLTSVVSGAMVNSALNDSSFDDYESTYVPSTLYVNYSYEKGENCQTVKPRNLKVDDQETTNTGNSTYQTLYNTYCTGTNKETFKSYCSNLEKYLNESSQQTQIQTEEM